MGGYNGVQAICTVRDGAIDPDGTKAHRTLWTALSMLNADQPPTPIVKCGVDGASESR